MVRVRVESHERSILVISLMMLSLLVHVMPPWAGTSFIREVSVCLIDMHVPPAVNHAMSKWRGFRISDIGNLALLRAERLIRLAFSTFLNTL